MAKSQATLVALTPRAALKKHLDQYNLSVSEFARGIKISPPTASLLLNGKLRISIKTAQRLSKFFGKTPEYWIFLQTAYDLAESSADKQNAAVLKSITKAVKVPVRKASTAKKAKTPAKTALKKTTKKAGPGRPRTKNISFQ